MAVTLIQAILVGIFGGLFAIEPWSSSPFALWQPLIPCIIVGTILGDPTAGLITGGLVVLAFMGVVQIGGAVPPNSTWAAISTTTLVVTAGLTGPAALVVSYPMALFGQYVTIAYMSWNSFFDHWADRESAQGNIDAIRYINEIPGLIVIGLNAIIIGAFTYWGAPAIAAASAALPPWFWTSLGAGGKLMTTLGVGILMNLMWDIKYLPLLLLGYGLAAYFGLGLLGTALVGAGLVGLVWVLGRR